MRIFFGYLQPHLLEVILGDVPLAERHVLVETLAARERLAALATLVPGPGLLLAMIAQVSREIALPLEQFAAYIAGVGYAVVDYTKRVVKLRLS